MANRTCGKFFPLMRRITIRSARTWPWAKIRPWVGQCSGPAPLSPSQSCPACTTTTSGYDFRKGHLEKIGVTSLGHRRKLLRAIADLKGVGRSSPDAVAAAPPATPRVADAAERRQVTVLFSDLVGSTALSTRGRPMWKTWRRRLHGPCSGRKRMPSRSSATALMSTYEELLRALARKANLKRILIPLPFAAWWALAWTAELLPNLPVTRNQVELAGR